MLQLPVCLAAALHDSQRADRMAHLAGGKRCEETDCSDPQRTALRELTEETGGEL